MRLYIEGHSCGYEMQRVAGLFLYTEKLELTEGAPWDEGAFAAPLIYTWVRDSDCGAHVCLKDRAGVLQRCEKTLAGAHFSSENNLPMEKGSVEHALGAVLYEALSELTGLKPPWGMLTGIRPVHLLRRSLVASGSEAQVRSYYGRECFVREDKLNLAMTTAKMQAPVLAKNTPDSVSLYVSIPFCPTRCVYCSFVSQALAQAKKQMPAYVEGLCKELCLYGDLLRESGLQLRTVYFGGGTPTTLSAEQLEQVLGTVKEAFDTEHLWEYTVEAGRPDTVDEEKLAVLRRYGVDRVSINPQTVDDKVLEAIGRGHTAKQFYQGVELARQAGFSVLNTDLIAGLPGDTPEGFLRSLEEMISLKAENITVHALAKKRGAHLEVAQARAAAVNLEQMVAAGQKRLTDAGYVPYYLYRQAGSYFGLENVGYAKPGTVGLYNVYSMEESHTVLAAGAGGVSKIVYQDGSGRIERVFNFKYPFEYLQRFQEIMEKKTKIFRESSCKTEMNQV